MSKDICTRIPETGKNLMTQLTSKFGYERAFNAMLKGAINPKFIKKYGYSLELDSSGVPTFESFVALPFVQEEFLGQETILHSLNKDRRSFDDTIENYELLLQETFNFNNSSPYKDSYVAQVVYTDDNKIKVQVSYKDKQKLQQAQDEYRQYQLNKRLASIFAPLGVTIGELSKVEVQAGRVGVTDFTIADKLAQDFVSMIRVANNREGAKAVSEEFSHLIIGVMRNNPLIQRSLNLIKNNESVASAILGEDYNDVVTAYNGDMGLVAEEALGHVLQDNLIRTITTDDNIENIFKRAISNIQQQFKPYKEADVENAIKEVESMMAEVAGGVIDGKLVPTREQIINSRRNVKLNALSTRIDRNLKILQKARETEIKRFKIGNQDTKEFAEANLSILEAAKSNELDTTIALSNYAKEALNQMRIYFNTLSSSTVDFATLREVKGFIASYGDFIEAVRDAILEDRNETDSILSADTPETNTLKDIINELSVLSRDLTSLYTKTAHSSFCDFLKNYLNDDIILRMKGAKGQNITVEELLNSAEKDISFFDRWLDSMGDSSDVLLQMFDKVVKDSKDAARAKTIDTIREIVKLRQEAEAAGITSFEWMFEKDSKGKKSGDYIRAVDFAKFYESFHNMEDELNKKYGKNPSGINATRKIAERQAWLKEYALSPFGTPTPNPDKWKSKDYANLSDKQKDILKKFIAIKSALENSFPSGKVNAYRAIQVRKDISQRLIDSGASPSTIFSNIKRYYEEAFLDRIDDDQLFGASSRGGLRDFEGHEYMVLPLLYVNRLENPDDLSTDVFSNLMQYAYMANNYAAMDKVVDALETGRDIVKSIRKVKKTRGDFPVIEKAKTRVGKIVGNVFEDESYIVQKLDDFFESQVYGRYLKDSGAFTVFGKPVNKNKLVSFLLNRSSLAQLGFNWLANTANVTTGACMQHIEAVAGEYFGAKELGNADIEYNKMLVEFIPELGARFKQSKLALFDELINFKGDFDQRVKGVQKKNILQRLFGESIAFIGQEGGDHWLYNRTAIAMAMRQKVIVPGKGETSLWEALQIVEDANGLKKMVVPKGTTDTSGKEFNVYKWSRQVLHVNQSLFGIYNAEDSNAANRVIAGRLLQQYRKWIKPQFNKRFQAAQQNLTMDKIEEGYYRTLIRFCGELFRAHVQLSSMKGEIDKLSDGEKANIKRALFELAQFFCVWALANLVEWPDDKDRPWAMKLAEYSARRLSHELGGLTPTLSMAGEMLKNVKNPIPASQICIDYINLLGSVVDYRDWTDELESGPYKGESTLIKNFLKAPIPIVRQYRMINKTVGQIDTSISYYLRPY